MIAVRLQPRTKSDIRVDALSPSEWRVCDDRVPSDDARSLIGFIERNRGVYEVIEFADPLKFSFFLSLEAALSHFVGATPDPVLGTTTDILTARAAS